MTRTASVTGPILSLFGTPLKLFQFLAGLSPRLDAKSLNGEVQKWAVRQGGKCEADRWRPITVCYGLEKGEHFGDGGTTIGNTFLNDVPPSELRKEVLYHELQHTTQFEFYYKKFNFWPTFLVYYTYGTGLSRGCANVYEREADLQGNLYHC
ncbi:hypothetical protein ACQP1V_29205 [Microtetraspora malaysiensis]|uniref:hypothetical protein n=1 Tax=Microtetraspora malaysiensis TaxID=161358 RepID=UPI003D8C608C